MQILIVDDDEFFGRAAGLMLCAADDSIAVDFASTGHDGIARIGTNQYDCVLLDYRLPDIDGLDVLGTISASGENDASRPPVIMLTANGDETVAVDAMKCGAADYIVKSNMAPDRLLSVIQGAIDEAARKQKADLAFEQLQQLALTDPVTQLGNRHLFDMRFEQALRRSRRTGEPLCLIVLDLDGFKRVNDEFGHPAGDQLLGEIGRRIANVVRDCDCAARYGGDEFAILMESGASPEGAATLAERIAAQVSEPVDIDGECISIGTSVGYALYPDDGDSMDALVRTADTAMYRAKLRNADSRKLRTALTG